MSTARTSRRGRAGMTLIEVIVALGILSFAMLTMASFIVSLAHNVAGSNIRTTAGELVADRLEEIKGAGSYTTLEAMFVGTESPVPGYPGYIRETMIQHVGGDTASLYDYKIVTAIVTAPALSSPVKKTTIISSF